MNVCTRKWSIMSASRLGSAEGLKPEPEGGANVHLSEVVKQHENMCPGAALKGEYASEGGPDGCAEEPGTTAEGDMGVKVWRCKCTHCQVHSNTESFRPQWKIDLCNVYATHSDDRTVVCHVPFLGKA